MLSRPILLATLSLSAASGGVALADDASHVLILTASNSAANQLLAYDANGTLVQSLATQGQGGVGGNAGGVSIGAGHVAVVNFGSSTVSVFDIDRDDRSLSLAAVLPTVGSPVSVAFSDDHLYVLTTTHVESHAVTRRGIAPAPDGLVSLVKADGSAAQVGVLNHEVIISEKANVIETVKLNGRGALAGSATTVANIPANVDAPFGLATRGDSAYVTIAHANEIALVRHDSVVTVTGSGTQKAPCWVALDGPYLFSANSPSKSVSRYLVHGQSITQEVAVAARFSGAPTDIAYAGGLLAVIDGAGTSSHVSVFNVDDDGNIAIRATVTLAGGSTNGVAILRQDL
jgi:6-phosphogluconolactonase (cycloisomerase 2 family)